MPRTTGAAQYSRSMGRRIDVDDLIDAADVAELLGLSRPNSVYVYLDRYDDMPRPVVDRGPRRAKLWLRSEIAVWQRHRFGGDGARTSSAGP